MGNNSSTVISTELLSHGASWFYLSQCLRRVHFYCCLEPSVTASLLNNSVTQTMKHCFFRLKTTNKYTDTESDHHSYSNTLLCQTIKYATVCVFGSYYANMLCLVIMGCKRPKEVLLCLFWHLHSTCGCRRLDLFKHEQDVAGFLAEL